ncbi:MAG: hypothetical protein LiPW39_614 [Parcubacteria group bacterium LiPW_39]|nr:MAG: hypothetical protein LiPW39_614 [Parcubacteria group bacterium LiPW_39]
MMTNLEKSIIATLIYYDLLDRPLTELEIYKYLLGPSREVSFFDFKQTLANLVQAKKINARDGLYFLSEHSELIKIREKRLKLAQLKWKKLKKIGRWLALVPFLRLVAVTGSLTAYNTRQESDFDLLIVAKSGRLWLTRIFTTALLGFLGVRRHDQLTRDRICLNCYLTNDSLEIKNEAKPRDWHSAQEYGRLTPILEIKPGLYQKFIQANGWLKNFLNFYPWPASQTARKIKASQWLEAGRRMMEWCLGGKMGDWLEKKLGQWQTRRIRQKNESQPADQVYVSDQCLMFHPQSKSYELMRQFNLKIEQLVDL